MGELNEVSTPLEQPATFQAMGRGVIHRQEDEHASIHDALITRIANCQVRTTLMSAALQAHPAPLPSPLETAIEVFDNHVQFVTHNRRTHEVWDPLSGSKSPPRRRGDLYRQSYLVLSLLRHKWLPRVWWTETTTIRFSDCVGRRTTPYRRAKQRGAWT